MDRVNKYITINDTDVKSETNVTAESDNMTLLHQNRFL